MIARLLSGCALALACSAAFALEILPYSAAAVAAARDADQPYALQFHSEWCATCKEQTRIFKLLAEEEGLDMKLFIVDFDHDRATVRAYKVPVSAVVIVFRGKTERARLFAQPDRDKLRDGLKKAF
jgi:thiol-disulfide isomerase/thioredoxin